jgi:3-oxoacyl-[acyl-carrier-protein] synthase II
MSSAPAAVPVVGAGALSAAGLGRQAIVDALLDGLLDDVLARGGTPLSAAVPDAALETDPTPARARGRVSRSAVLAAIAARGALSDAGWTDRRQEVGFFLGVGASGGALGEIEAILGASLEAGTLSLARLGAVGLGVSNPLFTFSTLHNFTLCHSAILEGTGGPNAAFFSRGAGTLVALAEAVQALRDGDCGRTLVGGADTALHPVTWAELVEQGRARDGLVPGEGSAILALGGGGRPLANLESQAMNALPESFAGPGPSHVLLAPWGDPPRQRLATLARQHFPGARLLDVTSRLGECLAAQPALGWAAAVELVARGAASRVLVLSEGLDGVTGSVVFGAAA